MNAMRLTVFTSPDIYRLGASCVSVWARDNMVPVNSRCWGLDLGFLHARPRPHGTAHDSSLNQSVSDPVLSDL